MSSGSNENTVIALPVAGGLLCAHFGHCEQFALFDVDTEKKEIRGARQLAPPPHEPGVLPEWLHSQGATQVIAGGMGRRAQDLFAARGIRVLVGAPVSEPGSIVRDYLDGKLELATNPCDH